MHLSPAMLEAAYDFLRTTPPFRGWRLPIGEEVEFRVVSSRSFAADYMRRSDGTHRIRVNGGWVGCVNGLMRAMMHEMCHMRLDLVCPGDSAHHGRRFKRLAEQVCRRHHLDPKAF